jgi:uncharacterized membrane protein
VTTHLGVMILFAACVSIVFGVLGRDEVALQVRLASRLFTGLVVGAWVVGWLMYLVTP